MSHIDERVVKMTFDNDAFEKRAATSLNTINKINQSLEMKGSQNSFSNLAGLGKVLTATTFDIADGVSGLSDRFSALGIVGMTVIQNMTNGLLNLGKTAIDKVMTPIIEGGKNRALNLEQARFMLNGLITEAEGGAKKVESILNGPVNDAVSGTRFGLDEAAVAASNLFASGITDSDDLRESLQAISGAASMTNREYGDMAQIFATVKSNGKLMTMQLRQFSTMGLNVSAELAKALGKTEEQINEMVTKGEISYEQFVKVMYKYWDQASRANDTYSGSLSNVKAALARIGAEFQSKGLVQMRKWFNSLIPLINQIKSQLGPLVDLYDKMLGKTREGIMSLFVAGNEEEGFTILERTKSLVEAIVNVVTALGGVVEHFSDKIGGYFAAMFPNYTFENAAEGLNKLATAINDINSIKNPTDSIQLGNIEAEINELIPQRDAAMKDLIKYNERYKKSVSNLSAAEEKRNKLEKKYAKNPTEDRAKKLEAADKEVEKLQKHTEKLKGLIEESDGTYNDIINQIQLLNGEASRLNTNPLEEFVQSVLHSLQSIGQIAGKLVEPFKDIGNGIVDTGLVDNILAVQHGIENLFTSLKLNTEFMTNIEDIGKGLYSIFHLIVQGISAVIGAITGVPGAFADPIISLSNFLAEIGRYISDMDAFVEENQIFVKAIEKVKEVLSPVISIFKAVIGGVEKFFNTFKLDGSSFGDVIASITDSINKINESVEPLRTFAGGVEDVFKIVMDKFKAMSPIFEAIGNVIESVFGGISQVIKNTAKDASAWTLIDLLNAIFGVLSGTGTAITLELLINFVGQLRDVAGAASGMFSKIKYSFAEIGNTLVVWQNSIKADIILKIAGAVLAVAVALKLLSTIPAEDLLRSVSVITALFAELLGSFAIFQNLVSGKNGVKAALDAGIMAQYGVVFIEMAVAISILAGALKKVSDVAKDPKTLMLSLGSILALISVMAYTLNDKKISIKPSTGVALMLMAESIKILTKAIAALAEIVKDDPVAYVGALGGLGAILLELAGFMLILNKVGTTGGDMMGIGASMILMGAALKIVVSVIKDLGDYFNEDPKKYAAGFGGLAIVLTEMGLFMVALNKMSSSGAKAVAIGASMILIGAALKIFVSVIKELGDFFDEDPKKYAAGFAGMALILVEMGAFLIALNKVGTSGLDAMGIAASMVIMGAAMEIFADVIGKLGGLWTQDWTAVLAALGAIGAVLLMFGGFTKLTGEGDLIGTATAILVFSAALQVMASALQTVGAMSIDQIVISFMALSGLIVVFGLLAAAMTTLAGVAGPGAAIIAAMAFSLLGFAVALVATAKAVETFASMDTDTINQFFDNIQLGLVRMKILLPQMLTLVGSIFTGVIKIIAKNALAIGQAIGELIINVLTVIRDNIGEITSLVLEIFTAFVTAIGDNIDDIVAAGLYVLAQFLEGLAEGIPGLITAAVDVIVAFIDGITANLQRIIDAGTNLVVTLMWGIATQQATIIQTAKDIVKWFLDEIGLGDFAKAGEDAVQGLIDGIVAIKDKIIETGKNVAHWLIDSIKGSDALDEHSPSKATEAIGQFAADGLVIGVMNGKDKVAKAAKVLGNTLTDNLKGLVGNSKEYTKYVKGLGGAIKDFVNGSQIGKYSKLASKLYLKSDDYKTTIKDLKKQMSEYRKLYKENQELLAKSQSSKVEAKERESAKKSYENNLEKLKEMEAEIAKIGKTISKGPTKALKNFRKEIKQTVKDYLSIKNLNFENIFDGFSALTKSNNLGSKTATDVISGLSGSLRQLSDSTKATSDQFNLLSTSTNTGINLLEKFSKVSTTTVRRLMLNAKSQVKAYEEFQNGIEQLRSMGLDSAFVDQLEAQGPSALGYIRGFLKMSADEIAEYNSYVKKQADYESKAVENNMKKQVDQYEQFYADIEKLAAKGLSEGIIKRLKEAGIEQATFVKALLNMPASSLENVNEMYEKSVMATDAISSLSDAANETYSSFADMLGGQLIKKFAFNSQLAQLKKMGLSTELIKAFEEMGADSAQAYVESVLKESEAGIKTINERYAQLMRSVESPGEVWLKNLKTSTSTYEEYNKNMKKLAKKLPQGKQSELYKHVESLGIEDGAEYAEAFLTSSKEVQDQIVAEFNKQQKENAKQLTSALKEKIEAIKQWKNDLNELAGRETKSGKRIISDELMAELVEMGPEAADIIHAMTEMSNKELKNFSKTYDDAMTDLPAKVSKSVTKSYAAVAGDAVKAFTTKVTSAESTNKATSASKNAIITIASNIKGTAKKKGEVVGEAAKNGVKTYVNTSKGNQLATNMADGMAVGFEDNTSMVKRAAKRLAKAAYEAMADALDINSPSKMTEQLGMFTDLGFVNGLEKYGSNVTEAARGLSDDIYSTLSGVLDNIQNGTTNELNYRLDVAPIGQLDFSNNVRQAQDIVDIFSNLNDVNLQLNRDANADVVAAMNEMRQDFQSQFEGLTATISQMQLVMDSGALVGQIVDPMNNALGQKVAMARRGM